MKKRKLKLRKEVKDLLVCSGFGIFCVLSLYISIVGGNYNYQKNVQKNTAQVPTNAVFTNNR